MNLVSSFVVAVLHLLQLPLDAGSEQKQASSQNGDAVYQSPSGDFVFATMGGMVYIGSIPENADIRQVPRLLSASGPLLDRSTSVVSCATSGHITLAIPRTPHLGDHYICNGVEFRVDECNSNCGSYQITATCRRYLSGRCISGPRTRPPALLYQLSGSRRDGITSIDFDPSSNDGTLTLRRGNGLLRLGRR